MTRSEIKKRRKEILSELAQHDAERKVIVAKLHVLYAICEHPKEYKVSHQGETSMYCPDCGHEF